MAAVFKNGLDVRIAKKGAYGCHPQLCLSSLSGNKEDGLPSSYCGLERDDSRFNIQRRRSAAFNPASENIEVMVVVVVFGTRVSETLGKLRVRARGSDSVSDGKCNMNECNMNASQPAALRKES